MIFDDVDRHLPGTGSFDRAAAVPGLFIAWCVNMGLISDALARAAEAQVVRLKYREITGGEFLVAACGGELSTHALSERGQAVAEEHYADYLAELPRLAGVVGLSEVDDKWSTYNKVAPWLTERHLGRPPEPVKRVGPAADKSSEPWWRFWK